MLLEIKDVSISYGDRLTVEGVNLQLEEGQICSIVGESGSGKTTVIRATMGNLPGAGRVSAGDIIFEGQSVLNYNNKTWRDIRGKEMSMIFQDSGAMMNPTKKIGASFVE